MATPAMLMTTATNFAIVTDSWPRIAPKKSVKIPEVEANTVVLATLVFARAAFDKYCIRLQKLISFIILAKGNNPLIHRIASVHT